MSHFQDMTDQNYCFHQKKEYFMISVSRTQASSSALSEGVKHAAEQRGWQKFDTGSPTHDYYKEKNE